MFRLDYDTNEPAAAPEPRLHIFQRKIRRRRTASRDLPRVSDGCIGAAEFDRLHTAALFAVHNGLHLDMTVTLDFHRLGIRDETGARKELTRFLKNFAAWCAHRRYPCLYVYCFESSQRGQDNIHIHAHVALHVPPLFPSEKPWPGVDPSRLVFRRWVQIFVGNIPRAARVSGGRKASLIGHWRAVTYLMKGFDHREVVQSAQRSPDGKPVLLGDLIPWPFCDPGPATFKPRIGVSTSLGPMQRAIGMPAGLESHLPQQFNPMCLDLFGDRPEARLQPNFIPIPRPFRGPYEDGVRDVRAFYPEEFILHVDPWGRKERPATECHGRPG